MHDSPGFITTRWDQVFEAARNGDEAWSAREFLYRSYWKPLYSFLRRSGHSAQDAEDLTQGFLIAVLNSQTLERLSPERGTLRTFLLRALQHHATDEWRRAHRQRRAPQGGFEPLEPESDYQQHLVAGLTPEEAYQRRWALLIIERAFSRLEAEYSAKGALELYRRLQAFLHDDPDATTHQQTAEALGTTVAAVKSEMFRLRARLRDFIRAEIRPTVWGESEIENEYSSLIQALGRSSGSTMES